MDRANPGRGDALGVTASGILSASAPTPRSGPQSGGGAVTATGPAAARTQTGSDADETQDALPVPPLAAAIPAALRDWDRYEVLELLGAGGMGAVYKARDPRLNRMVALKIIRPGLRHSPTASAALVRRFLREARLQAAMSHPHICKVFEIGELPSRDGEPGPPYIIMQLIAGQPLHRAQAEMSELEKVRTLQLVSEAMHAAHRQGLIHRDIKPSNIMIERTLDGKFHPYVMDFGLAREQESGEQSRTGAGVIEGTPRYMAPEQARGDTRHLDRRTDVYALGVTLYELLAGRSPYTATSEVDILLAVLVQEPQPLRQVDPTIPVDLEAVAQKCLEKEPGARYDSARALAEDLGRYLDGEPVRARRIGPLSRLSRRVRRHKLLSALVAGLVASLLLFLGTAIRTRLAAHERERQAQRQAELAERLGQEIKDMEWLLRSARQLELHDLGREKRIVRRRMAELQAELSGDGELGRGLAHYAIGRGHMALHEYPEALAHLTQAMQHGQQGAELYYALGSVLGKHYEQALYEARLSGGGDWAKKQLKEIEPRYLVPALAALQRSRHLLPGAHSYLDGLIAFYRRDHEAALRQADAAFEQAPWLYEARKLAADVHLQLALEARDSGRYPDAESEFASAVRGYTEAAAIGHSDAQIYEGLAEAWVRQIEMQAERGQPTDAAYAEAVAASDKLLAAEPESFAGLLKKAYAAQLTMAVTGAGLSSEERVRRCLTAARAALVRRPDSPYASDLLAACHVSAAEDAQAHGRDPAPLLRQGLAFLEPVIRSHPHFLWGINDLAVIYSILADHLALRGDPGAKKLLEKSLHYYSLAQQADPAYLKSYGNALCSYASLINLTDSVTEARALLARADDAFGRCLQINASNPACSNNYAILYAAAARRAQQLDQPVQPLLARALQSFTLSRKLGGSYLDTEQYTALSHLTAAREELRLGRDPALALSETAAALERCLGIAAEDPMCAALAVQREWVAAEGALRGGRPSLPALERALELAVQATRHAAAHPDSWQALAETHLRLARVLTLPAIRRQHIAAGRAALERMFALNPRHAAGRATASALELLRGSEYYASAKAH
ncbi:MAG: serine/threonine-protein kinase [Polyangia bacterium]